MNQKLITFGTFMCAAYATLLSFTILNHTSQDDCYLSSLDPSFLYISSGVGFVSAILSFYGAATQKPREQQHREPINYYTLPVEGRPNMV